jgi:hypothetical protein
VRFAIGKATVGKSICKKVCEPTESKLMPKLKKNALYGMPLFKFGHVW